ncbi:MAG: iron ABC transporter permease [Tagaea sp.]|nr:iron ABC transporter permease [Tagaea sp.]
MSVAAPALGTRERLWLFALAAAIGAISLWPLARLLYEAVAPRGGGFDLSIAERALSSPATWRAAWRTFETSAAGTAVSLFLGIGFALAVALTDIRAKAALVFVFVLPLVVPSQIAALAWMNMAGPQSALLGAFGLAPPPGSPNPMLGREGIAWLLGLEHAPLVFLAVRAGLRALPREAIEAARGCGANRAIVARTIVLPLMAPAILAGALLAFVSSVGNFGTPALLGIPVGYNTLVTLIYQRLAGFGTSVLAQAATLSAVIGAVALLVLWLHARARKATDSRLSPGAAPEPWRLGAARLPLEIALWTGLILISVVPFVALFAQALVPAIGVTLSFETLTWRGFSGALAQDAVARAFANSFLLAGSAAALCVAAALPLAYFVAWRRSTLVRAIDTLVELPYALPGIVLAIAMILVFIKPLPILGVSIYGTLWIIALAYVARFLVLALRPIGAAFAQLDPALDEAAAAAGAGFGRRLRDVALPMVAPAAGAGAILVFLTALNELTVSALLWSSGSETLGVIVFSLQEGGDSPLAAAVSILAIGVVVALMLALTFLARRLPKGTLPWAD